MEILLNFNSVARLFPKYTRKHILHRVLHTAAGAPRRACTPCRRDALTQPYRLSYVTSRILKGILKIKTKTKPTSHQRNFK